MFNSNMLKAALFTVEKLILILNSCEALNCHGFVQRILPRNLLDKLQQERLCPELAKEILSVSIMPVQNFGKNKDEANIG